MAEMSVKKLWELASFVVTVVALPSPTPEQRRWNSWDDTMHEWCRREDFYNVLPQLLSGEDPEFQSYRQGVAAAVRGGSAPIHP